MKHRLLPIFVLLLFYLPVVLPLFHSGFFVSDDGEWMIIRLSAFYQTLRDGQFPVRFLTRLNHGYGYPVANFLYPAYLYLGSILHFLGFGYVNTVKILLGGSLLISFIFSFLWLRQFFPKIPALVGSLFYLYTPYHLYDVYTRGSVGEVLALAVVAVLLWSVKKNSLAFSSLIYGVLVISHNSLALLFSPVIFIYVLGVNKKLLWMFPLGLGISCFFWLPALWERKYVIFDKVVVSNWQQYFLRDWKLLGNAGIIVLLWSVLLIFKKKKLRSMPHFFTITAIISLFFALPESHFFWQNFPLGKLIQFPWRFLSVVLVANAFLAGWLLTSLPKRFYLIISFLLVIFLTFEASDKLMNIEFINKGDDYYRTNDATTTVQDEYMPRWVRVKPTNIYSDKAVFVGRGGIKKIDETARKILVSVTALENSAVYLNKIYYPGWQAKIDGEETTIQYENPKGIMHIAVPKGNHEIEVVFRETPLRKASNIVSVVFLVINILLFLRPRWKHLLAAVGEPKL